MMQKRMRRVILSSVVCPAVTHLHIISKTSGFYEKVIEDKMCFDFLYKFAWNISHSKKNWAGYGLHVKNSLFRPDFNGT